MLAAMLASIQVAKMVFQWVDLSDVMSDELEENSRVETKVVYLGGSRD